MNLQTVQSDKVNIVRINEGRIDAMTVPELRTYLFKLIDEGKTVLGVDLSAVRFIDSSGLGVLVSTLKRIGAGGAIALWGLNREVKALFELTQLYKVFDIFESESDALQTLGKNAG